MMGKDRTDTSLFKKKDHIAKNLQRLIWLFIRFETTYFFCVIWPFIWFQKT